MSGTLSTSSHSIIKPYEVGISLRELYRTCQNHCLCQPQSFTQASCWPLELGSKSNAEVPAAVGFSTPAQSMEAQRVPFPTLPSAPAVEQKLGSVWVLGQTWLGVQWQLCSSTTLERLLQFSKPHSPHSSVRKTVR